MRFIPTKAHAAMDYLGGLMLVVVPLFWLNDSAIPEAAIWTPVVIGALILAQSMITDFELSLANLMPVPAHLMMDGLVGAAMLASPWVFGFADVVWIPHVVIGLALIGAALTTHTTRGEPATHASIGPSGGQPSA